MKNTSNIILSGLEASGYVLFLRRMVDLKNCSCNCRSSFWCEPLVFFYHCIGFKNFYICSFDDFEFNSSMWGVLTFFILQFPLLTWISRFWCWINTWLHLGQWTVLLPCCFFMWYLRSPLDLYSLLHVSRQILLQKTWPHWLHVYSRSPTCTCLKCFVTPAFPV